MSEHFAVVGCGTAAVHIHLPLLRAAGVDVSVFASRSRSSAEKARDGWGDGTVVDRWEDAVVRADVDAVVIATPNAQHRDVAVAALKAGKHVLVDKPMARTIAEADEMIAAAERSGAVLVPFQSTRFMPPFDAHFPAELLASLTPAEQRYLKNYSYRSRFSRLYILPGDNDHDHADPRAVDEAD